MILRVDDLSKQYPNGTEANRGISLTADEGEIVGLVGPNGAGKTTLIRQILGLLRPTSGRIWLDNIELTAISPDYRAKLIRQMIRYVPQMPLYYPSLTAQEILELIRDLWQCEEKTPITRSVDEILDAFDISEIRHVMGYQMSQGQHKLLLLAMALFHPSPLLIMDEPTSMVDIGHKYLLWEFIQQNLKEHAILLASHDIGEVRRLCHRVYVLTQGKVILQGTPEEVAHSVTLPGEMEIVFESENEVSFQKILGTFAERCELAGKSRGYTHHIRFATIRDALEFLSQLEQVGKLAYVRLEAPDLEQSLHHILRTGIQKQEEA